MTKTKKIVAPKDFRKARAGIRGLDEITGGGLPAERSTLICRGPGCGKTLLAMKFLVRGAIDYNEPGVFMAFEETGDELTDNVALERAESAISSLLDTWLVLRDLESNGERNWGLHVPKSRGMGHSNPVREFVLSHTGIQLTDVYIGPSGMLTGSARVGQEARERAEHLNLNEEIERQPLALERKRTALEGQIAALRAAFSAEEASIARIVSHDKQREASLALDRVEMGRRHQSETAKNHGSRTR
jgi:KaiC